MWHWGKVDCVVNPWNLAVSQSNKSCSVCPISFDFEHQFVHNQSQEDGKIIIKFVKSEDYEADIFPKNESNIIFQNHQEKLV